MNVRRLACFALMLGVAAFCAEVRADDKAKNPLEKAKAGQWVIKKSVSSGFTMQMFTWIDKVDGRKVHMKTQMLNADGKTGMAPATETVIDLDAKAPSGGEAKADAPKPKMSEETVEIGGKKYKCTKTETTTDAGGMKMTVISWTSPEIPVDGVAKMVTLDKDGKEMSKMELVECGDSGAKEKAVGAPAAPTPPPGGEDKGGMGEEKGGE